MLQSSPRRPIALLCSLAFSVLLGAPGCGGGSDDKPKLAHSWDWAGVIGTGQSLSVGALGTPLMALEQPYGNLKLSLGNAIATIPPFDPSLPDLAPVPLTEPLRPLAQSYPSAYPLNLYGETPHTAMGTQITAMVKAVEGAAADYVTFHTVVGESGQPMITIDKRAMSTVTTGTAARAYAASLFEAEAIKRLAGAAGKSYGIGAIVLTHGESDAGSGTYGAELFQMFTDYNADLPARTTQTQKIPLFVSQQNSVPSDAGTSSVSAIGQWKAGVDHPGDVVCVGPKYQYSYATDSAHVHVNSTEYERLGEKFGQVYFERVIAGHDWQPLQPVSVMRSANTITVKFHVPVPPLVWDTTLPAAHAGTPEWASGKGFEVRAATSKATIDSVEIVGDDTVKITVRDDLTGLSVTLSYAIVTDGPSAVTATGNPTGTFRWGSLRDSDPFMGAMTKTVQPNFLVAFQYNEI